MPIIDGVKFACDGCSKGHRTSKCTHTNRPLVEIKKKGRPVGQCQHCRELRRVRSVHGKCMCAGDGSKGAPKARVLPNGLRDALLSSSGGSTSSFETPSLSRVSELLNPCSCQSGGKCTCCHVLDRSRKTVEKMAEARSTSATPAMSPAGSSCCSPTATSPAYTSTVPPPSSAKSCCKPEPSSSSSSSLPAIAAVKSCCSTSSAPPPPTFVIPDLSASTSPLFLPSTHGTTACFCGDSCACRGCAQHDPLGLKLRMNASTGIGCQCGTRPCEKDDTTCGGDVAFTKGVEDILKAAQLSDMVDLGGAGLGLAEFKYDATAPPPVGGVADPSFGPLPSFSQIWPSSLSSIPTISVQSHPSWEDATSTPPQQLAGSSWAEGGGNLMVQEENKGCSVVSGAQEFDGGCGDMCTCEEGCGCRA